MNSDKKTIYRIGKITGIMFFLLITGGILLSACGITSSSLPFTGSSNDTRQSAITAMQKLADAGPFRFHFVTTGSDGSATDVSGEMIMPDRAHIVTNGQELIVVSPDVYQKTNGTWSKIDTNANTVLDSLILMYTQDVQNGIVKAQDLGTQTMNGVQARGVGFQTTITNMDGSTASANMKLWYDQSQKLPVHLEVDTDNNGAKTHTVQDLIYDPSITINPPATP